MTKTEALSLANALASDVAILLREGLPQEAMRADAAQAILRKLAELEPVAWSTTNTKDGKRTLEFGACMPTNPAYINAHHEWCWVSLYNLTGIIDHE